MGTIPKSPAPSRKPYVPPSLRQMGRNRSIALSSVLLRTATERTAKRLIEVTALSENLMSMNDRMLNSSTSCGLNHFLSGEFALTRSGRALSSMDPGQLEAINRVLEASNDRRVERRAFILKNYMDFYSGVASGEIEPVSKEGMPNYVEALGLEKDPKMPGYIILFKNGNCTRTKAQDNINLKKSGWELPYTQFTPQMFFCHFLDRLIAAHEKSGEKDVEYNSIFLKCSLSYLEALSLGRLPGKNRTWFSLSLGYAEAFRNNAKTLKGQEKTKRDALRTLEMAGILERDGSGGLQWRENPFNVEDKYCAYIQKLAEDTWSADPSNYFLVAITLTKEKYMELLMSFKDSIMREQVEGVHKIRNASFIAKLESGSPNFATNNSSVLGPIISINVLE